LSAKACDCDKDAQMTMADYNDIDAIFIAKITSILESKYDLILEVQVSKWYKGKEQSKTKVVVPASTGACGFGRLHEGREYLIYANYNSVDSAFYTTRCTRTTIIPTTGTNNDAAIKTLIHVSHSSMVYDTSILYDQQYTIFYSDTTFLNRNLKLLKSSGSHKYYNNDGLLVAEGFAEKGVANGPWKYYSSDGRIWEEGNYLMGKRNGKWLQQLDLEFKTRDFKYYKEGVHTYQQTSYYEGEISYEDYPSKDGKYWISKRYHSNGKLRVVMTKSPPVRNKKGWLEEGRLNGILKAYHENGILAEEGYCYKGFETGLWKFYDEHGKLIKTKSEKTKTEIDAMKD